MIHARFHAATIAVAALTAVLVPCAAHAQFSGNTTYDAVKKAYFVTGDATLSGDVTGNDIFVGKDDATNFATQPGSYTLDIVAGAITTSVGNTYPDGFYYAGVNVFGGHKIAMSGGSVVRIGAFNGGTINISGGNVTSSAACVNASTINISGGDVNHASSLNTSTVNISGGNVTSAGSTDTGTLNISGGNVGSVQANGLVPVNISGGNVNEAHANTFSGINISGGSVFRAYGESDSAFTVSGGTVTEGIYLLGTSTVDFVGTDLSFAYQSYNFYADFGTYADFFTVTGTIGGVPNATYNVFIENADQFQQPQPPNTKPHQFTFNGLAVVPEPGTLALALPALGIGAILIRRRKK